MPPPDPDVTNSSPSDAAADQEAGPAAAESPAIGNIDAETSVLAGLLSTPQLFLDVSEIVDPDDFGGRAHGEVYRAVLACDTAGRPIDVITVAEELYRAGRLSQVGGKAALETLRDRGGEVDNVLEHARIVAEKARLRALTAAGRSITAAAGAADADAAAVLEAAEQQVFDIGRPKGGSSLIEMAQAVPKMLDDLATARTSVLVGQSTGLPSLDRMTAGFQGGQLIVLAARPSMGKSALAVQLARHIAETSGLVVPLLSYEMSASEIAMRMLSTALDYDLLKLRQGDIPPGMERDLATAAQRMTELPMMIDDNPPDTIQAVRSSMRRLARRGQLGAIVVDYLQLMSADVRHAGENRTQEVAAISVGLKRLARELDVPVIALSQLNRQVEQRPNKRPMLPDLRESGSLEQDANAVMFIYRDSVYNAAADPSEAELIIAKQRNGPVGTVNLSFSAKSARFAEDPNQQPRSPARGAGPGSNPFG